MSSSRVMGKPENIKVNNAFDLSVTAKNIISISCLEDIQQLRQLDSGPRLVLGSATNVILDEYFDGTVIHVLMHKITQGDNGVVSVGAGLPWHELINYCLTQDLYGIENLTLIPGLVGAAPVQNIGAYGVEVSSVIHSVTCYNFATQEIETLSNVACMFAYRDSVFKSKNYMILSVQFHFQKVFQPDLSYPSLVQFLADHHLAHDEVSPRVLSQSIQAIRESKLPWPEDIPNVGSIFKNPIIETDSIPADFLEGHRWLMADGQTKLSAARLIELVLTGIEIPPTLDFYKKHSLVLINRGGAVFSEVTELLRAIQQQVHLLHGIQLLVEPEIIES
ncbi:UDP-N-acetylmuramate dehydrogenase [Gammaproteobacteria bacterium]|nr:UDP-N-acetylmuramate dehydrogenase [Gammaproteobacteria bacterium]MDA8925007.1 UDP-N-acetylmuramate dehydrogenase [Gammaproteobacteria bacterium]MDA9340477.1 UDP-N-acetylmuramate dehydrogenase [Gammaproteobacteria bacterium]MDB9896117.1 UDP-N-acetylmuramate dehydrogenase [Gammaproteobacteria bacterium]MDC0014481.1 UDP-N-acetylmuramate dehydrogenase [Gammaproteobacteria bacterium]